MRVHTTETIMGNNTECDTKIMGEFTRKGDICIYDDWFAD